MKQSPLSSLGEARLRLFQAWSILSDEDGTPSEIAQFRALIPVIQKMESQLVRLINRREEEEEKS